MPIYEYACNNCDHTLDALQKMSDDPLLECPQCGEPQLRRLISAPRFRLKGEGWYETDFKKDNRRNISSGDGESAPADKDAKSSGDSEKARTGKDSSGSTDKAKSTSGGKAGRSDSA
jgi:putative FmdB family regulatory protein